MTTKKTVSKLYSASMKVMGKTFTGKGKTIQEAIASIKPGNVAGMVILTVSKGDKSKERVLGALVVKRAFNMAGMSQEVALKNLSNMFDGI